MRILTLISKFPWPLTDGAVIRDFNLLRETARRHEVHLLCFLFQPNDREHFDRLRPFCKTITALDLVRPRPRRLLNAAVSLVSDRPYILAEYWREEMADALDRVVAGQRIEVIHSHFLHMSQYVGHKGRAAFVHDAHNLEHVLWQRLARPPGNPLYRAFAARQALQLVRFQQQVARAAEHNVVLSDMDRDELLRLCPEVAVTVVPNGAEVDYWTPDNTEIEPESVIYFGNLSWPPQAEAARWFHNEILPRIRQQRPGVRFYVVGQNPPPDIRRLAGERVIVTGTVPDIREYVRKAAVVVMPLRIGAGTKHRVFQALAMRKAVVATRVAAEGIALEHGVNALIADDPQPFAESVVRLLSDAPLRTALGERGRRLVLEHHDWRAIYGRLDDVFQQAIARRPG